MEFFVFVSLVTYLTGRQQQSSYEISVLFDTYFSPIQKGLVSLGDRHDVLLNE